MEENPKPQSPEPQTAEKDISGQSPPDSSLSAKSKPALSIRTMKSDTDTLFKTSRPSLLQMIGEKNLGPKTKIIAKSYRKYIVLASAAIILLAAIGIIFWQLYQKTEPTSEMPTKLALPPPFFATETSRTIAVKNENRNQFFRLMEDAMQEQEREGTIKRLAVRIQDGEQERFMTLKDFFDFYHITPFGNILNEAEGTLMIFIQSAPDGNRLGLAVKVKNPDRVSADMLRWESSLFLDLKPLFFKENIDLIFGSFEDRSFRNIDWRFLKLSTEKDLGLAYTIFPVRKILVLTTSKGSQEAVINRLYEAR